MFYFVKTPQFVKKLFPTYIWNTPTNEKVIYLSFDDGPTPKITEWVLSKLQKHQAKATFFCIGKNVENHPEIVSIILEGGHTIGNHTQNHLSGWRTKTKDYLVDVAKANEQISKLSKRKIFRPPYGKIKNSQAKQLQKNRYQIVMWDVLSADFDSNISKEKCLQNVLKNTKRGSIVVFHDSIKASDKLQYVLPKMLAYFTEKGFEFKAL